MDDPVNNHEMKRLKEMVAEPYKPVRVSPPYVRKDVDDFVTAVADAYAKEEANKPPTHPQDFAEGDWYDWPIDDDSDTGSAVMIWATGIAIAAALIGFTVFVTYFWP